MIAKVTTKEKILIKLAGRSMTVEALAKAMHRPVPTMRRNCGELAREGKLERSVFKSGMPTKWAVSAKKVEPAVSTPEPSAPQPPSAPSVQE
jgi:predicted ArsR family transcriptional regulator